MSQRDPLGIVGQLVAEKYRVERLVGEGGFAVVYRAQHTIWNKPVAIKFFNGLSSAPVDQREQFQQAFIQEGALLTELSSETAAIVQARDVGTYTTPEGLWVPFMVLEWLEGSALDEVLDRDQRQGAPPWTLEQVLRLLGQAAAALDVAHGKGIAHRDVKPANLYVLGDPRSGRATLKVLDFGVAKMVTDNTQLKAALAKTGTSVTSFTPQYGAPEQFSRSYGATGPWTDVYALALVAVEMLAGRTALDGEDLIQLACSSGHPDRRPTPRTLGVLLPDAVEAVFARALAVTPSERYARAAEFWQALDGAVLGLVPELAGATRRPGAGTDATQLATGQFKATTDAPVPRRTSRENFATGTPSTLSQPLAASRRNLSGPLALGAMGVAALGFGGYAFFGRPAPVTPETAAVVQSAPVLAPLAPVAPPPTCPPEMARIDGGQFFQGSDAKDAGSNEKPAHNVRLAGYCIDLHETTAREYKACSEIGKCKRAATEVEWPKITPQDRKAYAPVCTIDDPGRQDHPINCVTWEMAQLYCRAQGKRLPTEAEWEYATRGPDGRVYPWGDDEPTAQHLNACGKECVAWGNQQRIALEALYETDDGYATTAPVGKFPAGRSRFGPYDVVGNVWEWVSDWYGPYDASEKVDPAGPATGERKVIRGGAWNGGYTTWLRPSFRYAQDPNALVHGIGFRCARSLEPPDETRDAAKLKR